MQRLRDNLVLWGREGGAGEREDHGPRAVARQHQRLRAVPDVDDQKRDGGGAAAAVRED